MKSIDLIDPLIFKNLKTHIERLTGIRHPEANADGLQRAKAYLIETFEGFGLSAEPVPFKDHGIAYPNLVAVVPGDQNPEEVVLIGAHYDTVSVSPGADDNASGLAVLLEVARSVSRRPARCTVEFVAFSMEEQGLLGSRAYSPRFLKAGPRFLGAVVLECVGFTDPRPGSQRAPAGLPIKLPDAGNFIGIIGNTASESLCRSLEAAFSTHAPDLPAVSLTVPGRGELLPDTRRSDHAPFWDIGLPALMLTDTADFRNPHYHQPSDLPETLNFTFMARLVRGLSGLCLHL